MSTPIEDLKAFYEAHLELGYGHNPTLYCSEKAEKDIREMLEKLGWTHIQVIPIKYKGRP